MATSHGGTRNATPRRVFLPIFFTLLLGLGSGPAEAKRAKRRTVSLRSTLKLASKRVLKLTLRRTARGLEFRKMAVTRLRKKRALRRYRGPYVIKLFAGKRLLETVRFAFPLGLAAGEPNKNNRRLARQFAKGMRATVQVRIPFPPQLTHIELLDPTNGKRLKKDLRPLGKKAVRPPVSGPRRTDIFQHRSR